MRRSIKIFRYSIITTFIYVFIVLYFLFLINFYAIPNDFKIPIVMLIGFAIIIISIFYFFLNMVHSKEGQILLRIKLINENSIKITILCLMCIVIFIPPISFSKTIINWSEIGFLNYLRAIIFLIGCAFLPGANIFKILFPQSTLHERFKIEPFLLKISIYPLLSFTFLGIITLILDTVGLMFDYFTLTLFLILVLLFIFDFLTQFYRDKIHLKLNIIKIKVFKSTILILFFALGVIIIALSIQLSAKYLIPGDSWRGVSYACFIGRSDTSSRFSGYSIYWGYISFSLSVLSGIPYINVNVLLFPFLYLFITSTYLLMKAILIDFKEVYAVLSTILFITFSNLFYFFNLYEEQNNIAVSHLIFDGLLNFRFKSFSFFLVITSMALFIITAKTSTVIENEPIRKTEEFKILFFVALFILQSYMLYFFPAISGIFLIIIFCFFSNNKKQDFKFFLVFLLFFTFFFIFVDILSIFFFTWIPTTFLSYYLGVPPPILRDVLVLNALIIYSLLLGFLIFSYVAYRFSIKFFSENKENKEKKRNLKININSKKFFISINILFSIFLILEIYNLFLEIDQNFFLFYLNLIFINIGIIGILGIYLSYFSYKENKQFFYFNLTFLLFIIFLASILIFRRWLQYPKIAPLKIPDDEYFYMNYWFSRLWYYSTIPFSIFASIGIIKLIYSLKNLKINIFKSKFLRVIPKLSAISFIIFFSLSNAIISGIFWNNYPFIDDDEANMMGWVSENVPPNSNILIDRYILYHLEKIASCKTYYIWDEIQMPDNDEMTDDFTFRYDSNCLIENVMELSGHVNVLKITDDNVDGNSFIVFNFNASQMYGSIEFFIRSDDASIPFEFALSSQTGNTGVLLSIMSNGFYFYNGSNYNKITDIENYVWYHTRLDFECSDGYYMSLNEFHWKLTINGFEYMDYIFWKNISQIKTLTMYTLLLDSGYNVFLDNLHFSWRPSINIEEFFFLREIRVINQLKSKELFYIILSDWNKKEYRYLLSMFYKKKLYKYGNLAIYYADDS